MLEYHRVTFPGKQTKQNKTKQKEKKKEKQVYSVISNPITATNVGKASREKKISTTLTKYKHNTE